jgi:hypothetical protein
MPNIIRATNFEMRWPLRPAPASAWGAPGGLRLEGMWRSEPTENNPAARSHNAKLVEAQAADPGVLWVKLDP